MCRMPIKGCPALVMCATMIIEKELSIMIWADYLEKEDTHEVK